MPTRLIRWDCVRALLELLRDEPDLADVQVDEAFPGDAITPTAIWVDSIDGKVTYPTMTGPGQLWIDDEFTIPLNLRAVGEANVAAATDQLQTMAGACVYVLANNRFLGVEGVIHALIEDVKQTVGDTTAGPMAFGLVTVKVRTRITGV